MNREEKAALVDELAESLNDADAIFAVDYRGISVTQAAELRTQLAEADAVFNVVKNRLAKRAAEKAGTGELDELLVGPTALTLIKGDAVVAAKAIAGFSKQHEILSFKGGIMDGAALDTEGFSAIARLPGLDVLHGQLVGMTASPLTGLVAGLSNLISGLGRQLAQMAEQGLVSGEAPADEEAGTSGEAAEDAEEPAAPPEPEPDDPGREAEESSDDSGGAEQADEPSDEAEEPTGEEPSDEPETDDESAAEEAPAQEEDES